MLRGFQEVRGFRVFAFEGISADKTRSVFTVRADLALSRRYGIPLQDLPLLCRSVLERSPEDEEKRAFAYNEDDMRVHAETAAAKVAAAKQRKMPRKPIPGTLGAAWRAPKG